MHHAYLISFDPERTKELIQSSPNKFELIEWAKEKYDYDIFVIKSNSDKSNQFHIFIE